MNSLKVMLTAILLGCLAISGQSEGANVIASDVCVYGGTSGGAVAAIAAARLGKTAVLVSVNNHVGGMSSGGLGATDVGNVDSIGGIAAEFYRRVGLAYGADPCHYFEPHVAEKTFEAMLAESGVAVYPNQLLSSVTVSNSVIVRVAMTDGTVYRAKEFVDATYEGDLMAMAGVSHTWGREGTNVYGESLAGVRQNIPDYKYDPYVVPGEPASGLLPLLRTDGPGALGEGDRRMQVYNFRLCLTQNPTNRIPITAPSNYSELTYELLHRYIDAYVASNGSISLKRLIYIPFLLPNGKTDANSNCGVSTDYIGFNYDYPTGTAANRDAIYRQHKDYIAGLLYYLSSSTNVPTNVRSDMLSWGYAKDEFQDNGGWPYVMYVREARRMIGDYVMQQQDALGGRAATDSVALASYSLDCHPTGRYATNGVVFTEGAISKAVPAPYPISYRSIVPKVGECGNLFCTFALSASHVCFSSIRMEPVFMMTSQSAGTAAAFAIDDGVPVQQVSYPKLAAQLISDGQILAWPTATNTQSAGVILTVASTAGVTATAGWGGGVNPGGWPLPNGPYWHDNNGGKGERFVGFNPTLPSNGYYNVFLWWVQAQNRATNTPVDIVSATGTNRVFVDQQTDGSRWVQIVGNAYFEEGTNGCVIIRNDGTTGYVIANAVRWVLIGGSDSNALTARPVVQVVASDAVACRSDTARFTILRPNGSGDWPITVNYAVGGTAIPGVDYAALPGTVTIPSDASSTSLVVSPSGNDLQHDHATVTINLLASADYTMTALTNATVTIFDRPLNLWRRANFTAAELEDIAVSGDAADPDCDGIPNLLEYALGLDPKSADSAPFLLQTANGCFTVSESIVRPVVDVSIAAEWSTDLETWSPVSDHVQGIRLSDPTADHIQSVRLSDPTAGRILAVQGDAMPACAFFRFGALRR